MEITKRNNYIGIVVLIIGYLTFVSWVISIFIGSKISYIISNYISICFLLLLLSSGILLVASLTLNIRESRNNNHISRGMKYTFISIPPIAFCFLVIIVKLLL